MNVMEKAIQDFPKQFAWEPEVVNSDKLGKYSRYVLVGMGGSRLSGDLLNTSNPEIDLLVHSDYGLPEYINKDTLVICSSYSGNTEEVISAFTEAQDKGVAVAVLAKGGKLIELAEKEGVPYIQFPDTGIQPRSATGFSFRALAKLIGREDILKETEALKDTLSIEDNGKDIAEVLFNKIPVIYTSLSNKSLGYILKIKLNETGKIPAFYNVLPELNHNEMTGYDVIDSTKKLSENIHFVFIRDDKDNERIQKRMEVLEGLYKDRGFKVVSIDIKGKNAYERMFSTVLMSDWIALNLSNLYGTEANEVPMIEEFKKLIS